MDEKLTQEQNDLVEQVLGDDAGNDESSKLIKIMRECKLSNSTIMLTLFGLGTHTKYYDVLYDLIDKNRDKVTEDWIKHEVINIFHEIDKEEDELENSEENV